MNTRRFHLLHIGAQDTKEMTITHHFGNSIQAWKPVVLGLLGLLLNASVPQQAIGAQSDAPASIFQPWSNQDVRQGAGPGPGTPSAPAAPRDFTKPEAMPKDERRTSAPTDDGIPIYRKSGRSDLEDIRLGSRPEAQGTSTGAAGTTQSGTGAGDSFITVQPFSESDVRQGSRRQQSTTGQTETSATKPNPAQTEKEKKGFFGRALEKIGF